MKEQSTYTKYQSQKIIELLTSSNLDSIDLGFNLLKEVEDIDQKIFVAMITGYCLKKYHKSALKRGAGKLVKEHVEFFLDDIRDQVPKPINAILKAEDYIIITGILADLGMDPSPLIKKIIKGEMIEYYNSFGLPAFITDNGNSMYVRPNVLPFLNAFSDTTQKIKKLSLQNKINGRKHYEILQPYAADFSSLTDISVFYEKEKKGDEYTFVADTNYRLTKPGKLDAIQSVRLRFVHHATLPQLLQHTITQLTQYSSIESIEIEGVIGYLDDYIPLLNQTFRALPNLKQLKLGKILEGINLAELLEGTTVQSLFLMMHVFDSQKVTCSPHFLDQLKNIQLSGSDLFDKFKS